MEHPVVSSTHVYLFKIVSETFATLLGDGIGSSLDSALLVRGQISYWIQMWVGVYRLHVGFGIVKGEA
jgi:hypothetical protein